MTVQDFLQAIRAIEAENPRYQLGGDGSNGTCDCIGLIIGAVRRCGLRWPGIHGSNWTARNLTANLSPISGADSLQVGDLVYKTRRPGQKGYDLPSRYDSDPDRLDYYHVGVVRSVSPLRIVNCTTPGIRVDATLSGWSYKGWLTLIDGSPSPAPVEPLPTLRPGDQGETVRMAQQLLMDVGYDLPRYGADGSFGAETERAVRQFQADRGLRVDGVIGPATWTALLNSQNAPLWRVTIQHLSEEAAREIISRYGGTMEQMV